MEFGLYVTPVQGRTVRRFGAPPGNYIGAKRVGKQLEWDEKRIVAIPMNEYQRHRAEYDGAIAEGALKRHKAEEYEAQQKERAAAKKEAVAKEAERVAKQAEEQADTEPAAAQATGIRAIAETAPVVSPAAQTARPKPLLADRKGDR